MPALKLPACRAAGSSVPALPADGTCHEVTQHESAPGDCTTACSRQGVQHRLQEV